MKDIRDQIVRCIRWYVPRTGIPRRCDAQATASRIDANGRPSALCRKHERQVQRQMERNSRKA